MNPNEQCSPPTFTKELLDTFVRRGSTHQLECAVRGNPLPIVQWFKNDANIDNSPDYTITYNNGEAVLKFDQVEDTDAGKYTCRATNRLGQIATSAYLKTLESNNHFILLF